MECFIEKIDRCKNNPEKSSTIKSSGHISFSVSTILSFKSIKNMYDAYRGKDCIKKFPESLREHVVEIINFKKTKMKSLTKSSRNHIKIEKFVIFVKKNLI